MKASAAPFVPAAEEEQETVEQEADADGQEGAGVIPEKAPAPAATVEAGETEKAADAAPGPGDPATAVTAPDPSEVSTTTIEAPEVAAAPAAAQSSAASTAPAATALSTAEDGGGGKIGVGGSSSSSSGVKAGDVTKGIGVSKDDASGSKLSAGKAPDTTKVPGVIPAAMARTYPSTMGNPNTVWRPTFNGRVRSFSDVKGFGFIDCQETLQAFGSDVFIHRYQMAEAGLKVGQYVTFAVELNAKGQPQARKVQAREQFDEFQNFSGWPESNLSKWNQGFPKGGKDATPEEIEEKLRTCSGSNDMWDLIEQYGASFQLKHVVTALYLLGLCRQHEQKSNNNHRGLTDALVERMVLFNPRDLNADEASKVVWALAILDEASAGKAHTFLISLAREVSGRYHEFSPSQMVTFISALSRLVRGNEEDDLVGKITTSFSDYAMGIGSNRMPRFPQEDVKTWLAFLKEASGSAAGHGQQAHPAAMMGGMYAAGWGNGGMPVWGTMGTSPQRPPQPNRSAFSMMGGGPAGPAMPMWQGPGAKGGKGPMGMGMYGHDEHAPGGYYPGMYGGGPGSYGCGAASGSVGWGGANAMGGAGFCGMGGAGCSGPSAGCCGGKGDPRLAKGGDLGPAGKGGKDLAKGPGDAGKDFAPQASDLAGKAAAKDAAMKGKGCYGFPPGKDAAAAYTKGKGQPFGKGKDPSSGGGFRPPLIGQETL